VQNRKLLNDDIPVEWIDKAREKRQMQGTSIMTRFFQPYMRMFKKTD
jgi:hypothetical protein